MNRRSAAVVLCFSILSSSIMSCSDTYEPVYKEISYVENGAWWDDEIITPDISGIEDLRLFNIIEACPDSFVAEVHCNNFTKPYLLASYGMDGTFNGIIDPSPYGNVQDVFRSDTDKEYYVLVSGSIEGSDSITNLIYRADFETGVLTDPEEIRLPSQTKTFSGISNVIRNGDTTIYSYSQYDLGADGRQSIVIDDGSGDIAEYEPDFIPGADQYYVMNLMTYGGDIVAEINVSIGDENLGYIMRLDPSTMKVTTLELSDGFMNGVVIDGQGVFYSTYDPDQMCGGNVIYRYDPASDEISEYLDLNDTYINNEFGMSANYRVISAADDQLILSTELSGISWGNGDPVLMILTRSDHDPNEGKKVIELGYLSSQPYNICSAVNQFNRQSDEFYIVPTDRYLNKPDDLVEDIKGGTGPDMLIMDSGYAMLNNGKYLTDVSSMTGSQDMIYRVPVGVIYDGLIVRTSLLADPGRPGVTFDEYRDLTIDANNGINALGSDNIDVFNKLFRFSSPEFFNEDGRLSLDNEEFRALCEYIRDMSIPTGNPLGMEPVSDLSWKGYSGFFMYAGKYAEEYSIVGYPSMDGNTPEQMDVVGIAITACSPSQDACRSFIEMVSAPEVQNRISSNDPYSVDAMRIRAEIVTEEQNRFNRQSTVSDNGNWENKIDHFMDEISDAQYARDVDSSVLTILDEEIQPYLAGQCDIDEVIRVSENRINLMLAERG
ncbi:MAG: extracellular solute-binding protein [Clostridiales bacterium]|nr:extracellular solute-binding protein [Clostridiales bacterium]